MKINQIEAKRFSSRSKADATGCVLWTGGRDRGGYGTFLVGGSTVGAHRVAWAMRFGDIPNGLCVLHRCDVRNCVSVDHLFLGTHAENMADCRAKGRSAGLSLGGAKCPSAKLTARQVMEIRLLQGFMSQAKIGEKFGVSQVAISKIMLNKTWRSTNGQ